MITRLQRKAIQKKIVKVCNVEYAPKNVSNFKSVLLVLDHPEQELSGAFSELTNILNIANAQLNILIFTTKTHKKQELKANQIVKQDFGINGALKRQPTPLALNKKYDLVIGYYSKPNIYLDSILADHKMAFIAGIAGPDSRLLDLRIATTGADHDIFISELQKYLRVLKLTSQS